MDRMKLVICAVLQFGLLCSGYAFADSAKVITEEDLKGYKKTGDFTIPKEKKGAGMGAGQKTALKSGKGSDQEYYCKKGNEQRRKIDDAKFDVVQAKKKLDDLKASSNIKMSRVTRAEENIAKKEKLLFRAERDLSELENEAHRKGVPPGWLRCQF